MDTNNQFQKEKNYNYIESSINDYDQIKEKNSINVNDDEKNIINYNENSILYILYSAIYKSSETNKKQLQNVEELIDSKKELKNNNNLPPSSSEENKSSILKSDEKIKINEMPKIVPNKQNINKKKDFVKINLNDFYLLDEFSGIENFKIKDKNLKSEDCFYVYFKNNKGLKLDLCEKNAINQNYYAISIFNSLQKEYKLLFTINKYPEGINEINALEAIKNSWCCEYFTKKLKINFNEPNIKLSKRNNDDKKYDIISDDKIKSNNIINTNCNGNNLMRNNNNGANNKNINNNNKYNNNFNNNYSYNNYSNSINNSNNNLNNNYNNNYNTFKNNNNNNKYYNNNEFNNDFNNNGNTNQNNYNNNLNNNGNNNPNINYNNNLDNKFNYNNNSNNNNCNIYNNYSNNNYNNNSNNNYNNNYSNNNINNNNNYCNNSNSYNNNSINCLNNNNSNKFTTNSINNNFNNNNINYNHNSNNFTNNNINNNSNNFTNNNINNNYNSNNFTNNYTNNNNSNNFTNNNINNNNITNNKINNINLNSNNSNNRYNTNANNINQINNNENYFNYNNNKTIIYSNVNNNNKNKNNSNNNKININNNNNYYNDNDNYNYNDNDNYNENKENFTDEIDSSMLSGTVIVSKSKKKVKEDINNISYFFPLVGLNNVGATCFMNATLQCLLHISELSLYFLKEFPNDRQNLRKKNSSSESHGSISDAYYDLVSSVYEEDRKETSKIYKFFSYSNNKSFAPKKFKKILGTYNPQFKYYEANDSKDLILYLLQTFHEELNYMGDQPFPTYLMRPDQLNRGYSFNYFMQTYNCQNFSIASKLFFGTYENKTMCSKCQKIFFSYQKFEFISFPTHKYTGKTFNILDGFKDNREIQYLTGDNQYFCQICQAFCDGIISCSIIQPPNKLVINIDYGINKRFKVKNLIFEEIIDITDYINFNFGKRIKYQISGICTHLGSSGSSGHYIAFCRNKSTGKWYNFNDSSCSECDKSTAFSCGNPYLLIYEQI